MLRKANGIEKFVKSQPASFQGRSEWDAAAAALNSLAAAYGTSFPMPVNAAVRRVNDAEIEDAANSVVKNVKHSRKALKRAFTKEEAAERDRAEDQLEKLAEAAKALKSRIEDGRPSSGEAAVLEERFAAAKSTLSGRTLPDTGAEAWHSIAAAMERIDAAFAPVEVHAAAED